MGLLEHIPLPIRGGGVGLSFKKSLLESRKPSYLFIWVMYNVVRMVYQLVQAYRSQESSSSWLLLTRLFLLDSHIAEVIVFINFSDLNWFDRFKKVTFRL